MGDRPASGNPAVRTGGMSRIMWTVVLSLVPAGIAGVFIFGARGLGVIVAAVLAALGTEFVLEKLSGQKSTIADGSAVITGLLLAYSLPPAAPLWLPVAGSAFAIAAGKQLFGGLGRNIFNPALVGRAFLTAVWPGHMAYFWRPFAYDTVASATPLSLLKEGRVVEHISYLDFFLGRRGGCIGEVCIVALLAGAVFLLIKGYISWRIPMVYIGTMGGMVYIFGPRGFFSGDWLMHILSGGLVLGAFFMATDYFTSPSTVKGQVVFAAGCGVLTAMIRLWGRYPEGVCYAILIMNAATPLIRRYGKEGRR